VTLPTSAPAREAYVNWLHLWRQLVERQSQSHRHDSPDGGDPWRKRASGFNDSVRRRLAAPDSLRELLQSRIDSSTSVLDVGAGTGGWAIPLAQAARTVTCIEPSPSMLEHLRANLQAAGLRNVTSVAGSWPCPFEPQDVVLCSHAMYSADDLAGFVRALVAAAKREVYLVMRLPTSDGVMAEASRVVWGHPHDSPNIVIAYNALLEMGIYPDVVVQHDLWRPWVSESLEAALVDVKRRLGVSEDDSFDAALAELLARRLVRSDGQCVWPAGVRSALLYWHV
jgi:SAM-dependent methyltransferase